MEGTDSKSAYCIYALTDPFTLRIRYIGLSKDPYRRFWQHLTDANGTRKDAWIAEILVQNTIPGMYILEKGLTKQEAESRETDWIRYYLMQRLPLTNTSKMLDRKVLLQHFPPPSGQYPHDSKMTFESFDASCQPDAYEIAQIYLQKPTSLVRIIFYGNHGTGKTHLLTAIYNQLQVQNVSCLYVNSHAYLHEEENRERLGMVSGETVFNLHASQVLLIDDIDEVKGDETRQLAMYDLIDYCERHNLPVIATTHDIAMLEYQVGGSVYSRLSKNRYDIPMYGRDYRQE